MSTESSSQSSVMSKPSSTDSWEEEDESTEKGNLEEFLPQYLLDKGFFWIKKLGEGGFASVHKLKWKEDFVACKVIQFDKVSQKWKDKYIKFEAQTASKMSHPNIIKTLDVVKTKHKLFVFMQLASQGSVAGRIRPTLTEFKAQPLRLTIKWLSQTASALKYIHDKNFAHRDIKPENLLLADFDDVKVADFGLSTVTAEIDPKTGRECRTLSQTLTGTPEYRAPEMEMEQEYDARQLDVYALGVTLFEMLTGFLPFYDEDVKIVLKKKQSLQIPAPLPPGVAQTPPSLDRLMKSMLNPNPKVRPKMRHVLREMNGTVLPSSDIQALIWSQ